MSDEETLTLVRRAMAVGYTTGLRHAADRVAPRERIMVLEMARDAETRLRETFREFEASLRGVTP